MTDNYTYNGVGMTMTRLNEQGIPEPIKDRKIENRVNWIISKNIAQLQRKYDEWMAQAEKERRKCEAKRAPSSRHKMRYTKEKECLQMANSYKAVIEQLREESA